VLDQAKTDAALYEFVLRMGDNTLILGHRISEWCGVAPVLEEDIALANTALDLIGQTQMWLGLAAEIAGDVKTADELAFLRDVWDFRNLLLVERPNGDFGHTILRQFLFDVFHKLQLTDLAQSPDPRIAEIAAKAVKEVSYHLERSRDTVIALGDGTVESHAKMQAALDLLWPYVGEMFSSDPVSQTVGLAGFATNPTNFRAAWDADVLPSLEQASLNVPTSIFAHKGGKTGAQHTEHLGHLLATMQWLQRAYPGASW
jgi:ring-1,2-phenylacetyl-CoA epoxidase subunit PaaC